GEDSATDIGAFQAVHRQQTRDERLASPKAAAEDTCQHHRDHTEEIDLNGPQRDTQIGVRGGPQESLHEHREDQSEKGIEANESAGWEGKATGDVETHRGNHNEAENTAGEKHVGAFEHLHTKERGREDERVGKVDALWEWDPHGCRASLTKAAQAQCGPLDRVVRECGDREDRNPRTWKRIDPALATEYRDVVVVQKERL